MECAPAALPGEFAASNRRLKLDILTDQEIDTDVMSSVPAPQRTTIIHTFGQLIIEFVQAVGDLALFATEMLRWLCRGLPRRIVVVESIS